MTKPKSTPKQHRALGKATGTAVKPFDDDVLGLLDAEQKAALDVVSKALGPGSPINAFKYLLNGMAKRVKLAEQLAEMVTKAGGANPKNAAHWAKKRAETTFNIHCRSRGSWEIKGWDELIKLLKMKESYIRILFSHGRGTITRNVLDEEQGVIEIYTITREKN